MTSIQNCTRGDLFYIKDKETLGEDETCTFHPALIISKDYGDAETSGGHGSNIQYVLISSCFKYNKPKYAIPINLFDKIGFILPQNIYTCQMNSIDIKRYIGHIIDESIIDLVVNIHTLRCLSPSCISSETIDDIEKRYNSYVEKFDKDNPDLERYIPEKYRKNIDEHKNTNTQQSETNPNTSSHTIEVTVTSTPLPQKPVSFLPGPNWKVSSIPGVIERIQSRSSTMIPHSDAYFRALTNVTDILKSAPYYTPHNPPKAIKKWKLEAQLTLYMLANYDKRLCAAVYQYRSKSILSTDLRVCKKILEAYYTEDELYPFKKLALDDIA